jgi:hypothetical protein
LKNHKPWFDEGPSQFLHQWNKPNCSGHSIQAK